MTKKAWLFRAAIDEVFALASQAAILHLDTSTLHAEKHFNFVATLLGLRSDAGTMRSGGQHGK